MLADALHYARELGATHLVDFATLTGAMNRALGDLYAGVMGNDDEWRDADRRRRRGERRPRLAVADAPALPRPDRLRVRRHEELLRARAGAADLRGVVPRGVRRRRPMGARRRRRHRVLHVGPDRLPLAEGRHRLRRPPDRRAGDEAERRELRPHRRARARPEHGPRLRRAEGRARRRGARPRAPLPVRARRGARRARADGHADPRGVRRRRQRHALVRDRDRGADAHRLVRRDHGRGAHVARDDADLPVRVARSRSTSGCPTSPREEARGVRADRAGRGLGRRRLAHARGAERRRMGRSTARRSSSRTRARTSPPA